MLSACLPSVRLLLVKLFPILGGSSVQSRQQYYNYGSGNELGNLSHSRKSFKANSTVSSPKSKAFEVGDGVTIKRSFAVQYGNKDVDEASLVSHGSKIGPK